MNFGKQFSWVAEYLGSAWNSEGRKIHIVSVSSSSTQYRLLKEKLTPLGFFYHINCYFFIKKKQLVCMCVKA